jgi:hypothetical protein
MSILSWFRVFPSASRRTGMVGNMFDPGCFVLDRRESLLRVSLSEVLVITLASSPTKAFRLALLLPPLVLLLPAGSSFEGFRIVALKGETFSLISFWFGGWHRSLHVEISLRERLGLVGLVRTDSPPEEIKLESR